MAIVRANLNENILSRQEIAVIRCVSRAVDLNEALVALLKIATLRKQLSGGTEVPDSQLLSVKVEIELANYLRHQIDNALNSIKLPAIIPSEKPSPKEKTDE